MACNTTLEHLRAAWQGVLGREIKSNYEQWQTALTQIHKSSICARQEVFQIKIIHCLHWFKQKPGKMLPEVDPASDCCGLAMASLEHMFWSCRKIKKITGIIFLRPFQKFCTDAPWNLILDIIYYPTVQKMGRHGGS